MRIYEAETTYKLIASGEIEPITTKAGLANYIADAVAADPMHEQMWIITMNIRGEPIARHRVAIGPAEGVMVSVADIFRAVLVDRAHCFTAIHNHPDVERVRPSYGDRQAAQAIVRAGILMRLPCYDFVIVSSQNLAGQMHVLSFREAGWPGITDLNFKQYRTGPEEWQRGTKSLPPPEDALQEEVLAKKSKEDREACLAALKELERQGYAKCKTVTNIEGKLVRNWTFDYAPRPANSTPILAAEWVREGGTKCVP